MQPLAHLPWLLSARADGFYLNPEFNAGWSGSDFTGSVLEGHVGWEKGGLYIQGGPAYAQPDGGDAEVGLSGKMGINAPVSESLMFTAKFLPQSLMMWTLATV